MKTSGGETMIDKEFPVDEAPQQVHLARQALLAAAKRKRLTFGVHVRSLGFRPRNAASIVGPTITERKNGSPGFRGCLSNPAPLIGRASNLLLRAPDRGDSLGSSLRPD